MDDISLDESGSSHQPPFSIGPNVKASKIGSSGEEDAKVWQHWQVYSDEIHNLAANAASLIMCSKILPYKIYPKIEYDGSVFLGEITKNYEFSAKHIFQQGFLSHVPLA